MTYLFYLFPLFVSILKINFPVFFASKFHNNLPLYSLYCLLEFGLLSLYFNRVIDVFAKDNIGIHIGITGIVIGILDIVFFEHLGSYNTYFLFFEDLMVMGMSLFALFRLMLNDDSRNLFHYPHFWFICIFVFFWSITFLNWGLYDYIDVQMHSSIWKIDCALMVIGIVTYSSFGVVFLLYPKLQKG